MRNFMIIAFFVICTWGALASDMQIDVVVSTNGLAVSEKDMRYLQGETAHAVENIAPVLGITHNITINILVTDYGICNAYHGILRLPIWHIKKKRAAIAHEVSHVLAGHQHDALYTEGLAVYFHQRFGRDKAFPYVRSKSFRRQLKKYRKRLLPLSQIANSNFIFMDLSDKRRKMCYLQAGSFMGFIVDTYGEDKLRQLNNRPSVNYDNVYGKSLAELEQEWRKTLRF